MRQSAADAVILLKNDRGILPLPKTGKRIAVIGPNAERAQIFGGGSAALKPTYTVSPLEGIGAAVGEGSEGEEIRNSNGQLGFDITFYNEPSSSTSRKAIHKLSTTNSSMFFNDNLPEKLNRACYATVSATFTPSRSGIYQFGVGALGISDLYVDDVLLIDNSTSPIPGELFYGKGSREEIGEIHLKIGVTYGIRVEYASPSASTSFVGPLALSSRGGLRFADIVVLVAGLNAEFETEGFDRQSMSLLQPTLNLIETILSVRQDRVVCLQRGTPLEIPFIDRCSTLVHFFYNGNETGNGLSDVLFGDVNPSAKLPFTIARLLSDCQSHKTERRFPGVEGKVYYDEGVFVGYRQFVTHGPESAFPFGHGLSYTSFEYQNTRTSLTTLELDSSTSIEISCTIKNTGSVVGREIVQLYISPLNGQEQRPKRELKSFKKTSLIQPGKEEVVNMKLDKESFAIWDTTKSTWIIPKGKYEIMLASSSEGIRDTITISIESDFSF
ncbi:hypothetical protein I204_06609 [Kwoniella mangroviensis CBS 8886]|nr:hypothetical protein I204_06609 [Kwoniella mangroviensis CBS 8886]